MRRTLSASLSVIVFLPRGEVCGSDGSRRRFSPCSTYSSCLHILASYKVKTTLRLFYQPFACDGRGGVSAKKVFVVSSKSARSTDDERSIEPPSMDMS